MNFVRDMFSTCSKCRVCEGAAYQAPPALYAGTIDSPVLVMAQNPGEMNKGWLEKVGSPWELEDAAELKRWYDNDFGLSHGHERFAKLLGSDFLERVTYTNAVRCRTRFNASPLANMITACSIWTNILAEGKSSILLSGKVAAEQFLGTWPKLGEILTFKRWRVLCIPHYTASGYDWSDFVPVCKEFMKGAIDE